MRQVIRLFTKFTCGNLNSSWQNAASSLSNSHTTLRNTLTTRSNTVVVIIFQIIDQNRQSDNWIQFYFSLRVNRHRPAFRQQPCVSALCSKRASLTYQRKSFRTPLASEATFLLRLTAVVVDLDCLENSFRVF